MVVDGMDFSISLPQTCHPPTHHLRFVADSIDIVKNSRNSRPQALNPAAIDPVGQGIQLVDPLRQIALHLIGALNRSIACFRGQLLHTGRTPVPDHVRGHFHMALQGQMLAQRVSLMTAMAADKEKLRPCRQRKGFTVPVKHFKTGRGTEPVGRL